MDANTKTGAEGIEKVYNYLNDSGTYYLATVDGNKPQVRPFGTILLDDGKLYIQTGKGKRVVQQLSANPNAQICACKNDGTWIRVSAELVPDNRREIKEKMLEKMPVLKNMYSAEDDSMQMYWLKDGEACICSFAAAPETIQF